VFNDYQQWEVFLPIAFPIAQAMKLAAITVDFFVWPATLRDINDSVKVCAAQNDSVM
jgi:hypothetical protein